MRVMTGVLVALLLAAPAVAQAPVPATGVEIAKDVRSVGRSTDDRDVEEVTLVAVPAVASRVRGLTVELPTIVRAGLSDLFARLSAGNVAPGGAPMVVYVNLGESEFTADIVVPLAAPLAEAPTGLRIAATPEGRALRMVHTGAYEGLDETYEQLATFVEDSGANVREVVIERYLSDPATTPESDLLTELYVLLQ